MRHSQVCSIQIRNIRNNIHVGLTGTFDVANENIAGAMKKKRRIHTYFIGLVHHPLVFFFTLFEFLSIVLEHIHRLYSSRHFLKHGQGNE